MVVAAIDELVHACEQTGDIRTGIDPADMLQLMCFMWRSTPAPTAKNKPDD